MDAGPYIAESVSQIISMSDHLHFDAVSAGLFSDGIVLIPATSVRLVVFFSEIQASFALLCTSLLPSRR
jgi:hypothetical protein